MDYWHDLLTEKSWKILQDLKGKFSFILIGGWAVYLWARTQKSKDIDIIVDLKTLADLKKQYTVNKNDNLKKYEIKYDKNKQDAPTELKHQSYLMLQTVGSEGAG